MPVWHEKAEAWRKQYDLVLLGVTQEQHPQRCRLFAQWKQIDWPILHDPINVIGCSAVPIVVAIDEHGIVRSVGPRPESFEQDFLKQTFPKVDSEETTPSKTDHPDLAVLRKKTETDRSADAWRRFGDAVVLWAKPDRIDEAIDAYQQAIQLDPGDDATQFRLGVCFRMRYDSPRRRPGDFQAAVDHWSEARTIRPNWYIYRRRIEQYGPRLIKPYPFYDWVAAAQAEITARGDKPISLPVLLSGAEIAMPSRNFADTSDAVESPDPQGRIHRDTQGLIATETTVVPPRIPPSGSARVHLTMRPSTGGKAHWNNESEPLRVWIDPPAGWQVEPRLLSAPQGDRPETTEPRHLEFELRAPAGASGRIDIPAYALYYVCEDAGGRCLFLRQDIAITVRVGK